MSYQITIRLSTIRIVLLTIAFGTIGTMLQAQSASELRTQKDVINQKIELTNQYLNDTRSSKSKTLSNYRVIEKQLKNRKNLVGAIATELDEVTTNISQHEAALSGLQSSQISLRRDYETIMRSAYKRKLLSNNWVSILSAGSIREAFLNVQYARQFESYAARQAELLKIQTDSIKQLVDNLNGLKQKNKSLLAEEQKEQTDLQRALNKKESLLNRLKKDEKKYLRVLEKQSDEQKKLNELISLAIKREMSSGPSDTESIKLSSSFAENKGRLPWPVMQAVVTSGFGVRQHPTNRNVKINNDGIDIRTVTGSEVKAIFEGEVKSVNQIPGFYNVVIVQVGSYFMVYGKLTHIRVATGQRIKRGETIGKAAVEGDFSEIQFQIWKGQVKQDPETWLRKK